MGKKWLLILGPILMLAIVALAGCSPGSTTLGEIKELNLSSQQEGIWVIGTGKVAVVPDIANLSLGIESHEVSVAEAQSKAIETMDRVMTVLSENGVAEEDIQTQYFRINRVTKWDRVKEEEVVVGYRVTNMVRAKIRDIEKAGSIIDAVAEAGGDVTRIDSISFSVDDPSTYYEEAREKAMADAKTKAEQLADLSGMRLGNPTYISESIRLPPIVPLPGVAYEYEEAAVAETPISPGEVEISLDIQVVYAILE